MVNPETLAKIATAEILSEELGYKLCKNDQVEMELRYVRGGGPLRGWQMRARGMAGWFPLSNHEVACTIIQTWKQEFGSSIIFSLCCICGNHDLGVALNSAGAKISHGYCDTCCLQWEERNGQK